VLEYRAAGQRQQERHEQEIGRVAARWGAALALARSQRAAAATSSGGLHFPTALQQFGDHPPALAAREFAGRLSRRASVPKAIALIRNRVQCNFYEKTNCIGLRCQTFRIAKFGNRPCHYRRNSCAHSRSASVSWHAQMLAVAYT
jgi:hypothetical protein